MSQKEEKRPISIKFIRKDTSNYHKEWKQEKFQKWISLITRQNRMPLMAIAKGRQLQPNKCEPLLVVCKLNIKSRPYQH